MWMTPNSSCSDFEVVWSVRIVIVASAKKNNRAKIAFGKYQQRSTVVF